MRFQKELDVFNNRATEEDDDHAPAMLCDENNNNNNNATNGSVLLFAVGGVRRKERETRRRYARTREITQRTMNSGMGSTEVGGWRDKHPARRNGNAEKDFSSPIEYHNNNNNNNNNRKEDINNIIAAAAAVQSLSHQLSPLPSDWFETCFACSR